MSAFWILFQLKVMEVVVTWKAPSNFHHQQTNSQLFTWQMSFLSPTSEKAQTQKRTI